MIYCVKEQKEEGNFLLLPSEEWNQLLNILSVLEHQLLSCYSASKIFPQKHDFASILGCSTAFYFSWMQFEEHLHHQQPDCPVVRSSAV